MQSPRLSLLCPSNQKGFTLVELLIVLVLTTILSLSVYLGVTRSQDKNMNAKVLSDLTAIENALDQYKQDHNGSYPLPSLNEALSLSDPNVDPNVDLNADPNLDPNPNLDPDSSSPVSPISSNLLCFGTTGAYLHDCSGAFFMQTPLTSDLLSPRYLPNLPTDPRTGNPYVYGVSFNGKSMQVAGNYWDTERKVWIAKMEGHLNPDFPFNSLIRSYNGPNFVVQDSSYLPYPPERMELSAQVLHYSTGVTLLNAQNNPVDLTAGFQKGYTLQVPQGGQATLYYSDGSVSLVGSNESLTQLTLLASSSLSNDSNPNSSNSNPNSDSSNPNSSKGPASKVFLKLTEGKVFNKVVHLSKASEFNIQTTTSIAGVRGTEFALETGTGENGTDRVYVYSGSVAVRQKTQEEKTQEEEEGENGFVKVTQQDLNQDLWTLSSPGGWVAANISSTGLDPLNNQPIAGFTSVNLTEQEQQGLDKTYLLTPFPLTNTFRPTLLGLDAPGFTFTLQGLEVSQLLNLNNNNDNIDENDNNDYDKLQQDPQFIPALQADGVLVCSDAIAQSCEQGQNNPDNPCNLTECVAFPLPNPQDNKYVVTMNENEISYMNSKNPNRFAFTYSGGGFDGMSLSSFSSPAVFMDSGMVLNSEEIEFYNNDVIFIDKNADDLENTPQYKCEIGGQGYWWQQSCWTLSDPNQSCSEACSAFGEQNDFPGLTCDPGNWNDTDECMVCEGLVGGKNVDGCDFSPSNYAPFFYKSQNSKDCRYFEGNNQGICETPSIGGRNRICKCSI